MRLSPREAHITGSFLPANCGDDALQLAQRDSDPELAVMLALRAVGREPNDETIGALRAAVAPVALEAPAGIGGGRSDMFIAGYSFRLFGAETFLASGTIPQWNPYLFGGLPYIAAMHGDIFYPTAWLRWRSTRPAAPAARPAA